MAVKRLSVLFATVFFTIVLSQESSVIGENSFALTDANWTAMLKDEWLVKFYAPWCPACRSLESTWESLAEWSLERNLKFGGVDVTEESGLSGRFIITSLPTIYHVKDGAFRQYVGSRALEDFQEFIAKKKWQEIEPVSDWKSPNSFIMSSISKLFGISMKLKDLHTSVTETYGVPVWASFVLFGVLVVALGLLLGMVMVFVSDYIFGPPCPPSYPNMEEVPIDPSQREQVKVMQDGSESSDEENSKSLEGEEDISGGKGKDDTNVRQRKVKVDE